jgi:hypothetical protein
MVGMPARRRISLISSLEGIKYLRVIVVRGPPDRRYTEEKTIGDSLRRSIGDARDSRDIGKSTVGDYMD